MSTGKENKHQISIFSSFAKRCADFCGKSMTFGLACFLLFVWACTGPHFSYSDTWQLVINTGTTIITFLTVFLIQNTQNRDSEAVQIKLDEIIKALKKADNRLLDLEEEGDEDLKSLYEQYKEIGRRARATNLELNANDGNHKTCCTDRCGT